jgi:hypothetical protein
MIGRLCLLPLVLTAPSPLPLSPAGRGVGVRGAVQQENPPAGWSVFTSKAGAFSVALPRTPTESKQKVMIATGTLDVFVFVAEAKDDATFVVSYSDLPAEEAKPGTAGKRLDFARDGAVSNSRGKLRTQKKIELDGHPGRDLVIETDKEIVIRMRVFAVNRRLYQAMAMSPGGAAQAKEAVQFLDSLRLIK